MVMSLLTSLVCHSHRDSFHAASWVPLQDGQGWSQLRSCSWQAILLSSSKWDLWQHVWGLASDPPLGPEASRPPSSIPSSPRAVFARAVPPLCKTKQGGRSLPGHGHQDARGDKDPVPHLQAGQASGVKGLSHVVDCHMVLGMQREREAGEPSSAAHLDCTCGLYHKHFKVLPSD